MTSSRRLPAAPFVAGLLALVVLALLGSCDRPGPTEVANRRLTVEVGGHGTGTITSDPAGISCGSSGGTCTVMLPAGARVTLTPAAGERSVFGGWSRGCSGAGACVVTLSADQTVAASFDNPGLAVQEIGPGGGTVRSVDERVTLTVPAGALPAARTLTIERVEPSQLGPEFGGITVADAYVLGPAGTTFQQPVQVSLTSPQQPVTDQEGFHASAELLLTSRNGAIEPLDSATMEVGGDGITLHGRVGHFSPLVRATSGVAGGPPTTFTLAIAGVPASGLTGADFQVDVRVIVRSPEPAAAAAYTDLSTGAIGAKTLARGQEIELPLVRQEESTGALRYAREFGGGFAYACNAAGAGTYAGAVSVRAAGLLVRAGGPGGPLEQAVGCQQSQQLTVRVTGQGSVTSSPAGIQCTAHGGTCTLPLAGGTQVTLTAAPGAGFDLSAWSDACQGGGTCTFVLDADRSVQADFRLNRTGAVTAARAAYVDSLAAAHPILALIAPAALPAGTRIRRVGGSPELVLERAAWYVLADLAPEALLPHPFTLLLVDVIDASVKRHPLLGPPAIDGATRWPTFDERFDSGDRFEEPRFEVSDRPEFEVIYPFEEEPSAATSWSGGSAADVIGRIAANEPDSSKGKRVLITVVAGRESFFRNSANDVRETFQALGFKPHDIDGSTMTLTQAREKILSTAADLGKGDKLVLSIHGHCWIDDPDGDGVLNNRPRALAYDLNGSNQEDWSVTGAVTPGSLPHLLSQLKAEQVNVMIVTCGAGGSITHWIRLEGGLEVQPGSTVRIYGSSAMNRSSYGSGIPGRERYTTQMLTTLAGMDRNNDGTVTLEEIEETFAEAQQKTAGWFATSGVFDQKPPPPAVFAGPSVQIAQPLNGRTFLGGTPILFEGSGFDNIDGALSGARLRWSSSLDGAIGTGTSFSRSDLSQGTHVITLVAEFSRNRTLQQSVTITIGRAGVPQVAILQPQAAIQVRRGTPLRFVATATDAEDGDIPSSRVLWRSDRDGDFATGLDFTIDYLLLSAGTHTITAEAEDEAGNVGTASVTIEVLTGIPDVHITTPEDGEVFPEHREILFIGAANDPEDGVLNLDGQNPERLIWRSSLLEGEMCRGFGCTRTLPPGTHVITLEATDSDGNTATASITITVTPAQTALVRHNVQGGGEVRGAGEFVCAGDPDSDEPNTCVISVAIGSVHSYRAFAFEGFELREVQGATDAGDGNYEVEVQEGGNETSWFFDRTAQATLTVRTVNGGSVTFTDADGQTQICTGTCGPFGYLPLAEVVLVALPAEDFVRWGDHCESIGPVNRAGMIVLAGRANTCTAHFRSAGGVPSFLRDTLPPIPARLTGDWTGLAGTPNDWAATGLRTLFDEAAILMRKEGEADRVVPLPDLRDPNEPPLDISYDFATGKIVVVERKAAWHCDHEGCEQLALNGFMPMSGFLDSVHGRDGIFAISGSRNGTEANVWTCVEKQCTRRQIPGVALSGERMPLHVLPGGRLQAVAGLTISFNRQVAFLGDEGEVDLVEVGFTNIKGFATIGPDAVVGVGHSNGLPSYALELRPSGLRSFREMNNMFAEGVCSDRRLPPGADTLGAAWEYLVVGRTAGPAASTTLVPFPGNGGAPLPAQVVPGRLPVGGCLRSDDRALIPQRELSRTMMLKLMMDFGGDIPQVTEEQEEKPIFQAGLRVSLEGRDAVNPFFAVGGKGVVAHLDGGLWRTSIEGGTGDDAGPTLRAVWAASATDAWAAGDGGTILRFNGANWSRVPNPAENTSAILYGLDGSSANDVYAVGERATLLRWNGSSWTPVSAGLGNFDFLLSVWSGGPDNVYVGGAGFGGVPLMLRFNGTTWSRVTLPQTFGAIIGIWGSGPADVWAISQSGGILHWDGTAWSVDNQTLPQLPGGPRMVRGIGGGGPNDVFIVAIPAGAPGSVSSVVLRYDGTGWTVIHEDMQNLLFGVEVAADGEVFVIGSNGTILRGVR